MGADSNKCLSFSRCADRSFISWPFCGRAPPGNGTVTSFGVGPPPLEAAAFFVLSALARVRRIGVALALSDFELRLDSSRLLLVLFFASRLVPMRFQ